MIPFELNGSSTPRYHRLGYCLDVVLPAAVAKCVERPEAALQPADKSIVAAPADIKRLLHRCLLVEDNLFIAIDAEDLLRSLGAESVVVANSVADALAVPATQTFSFALLDVSLGLENSLPVARYVKAHSVPFAFGTGYGEDLTMGDALVDVPIITKPYHRISMLKALDRLTVPSAAAPEHGRSST